MMLLGVAAQAKLLERASASRARAREEEENEKVRRRKLRPELKAILGFDFNCDILLDNNQIYPYGIIEGTLCIENNAEKAHKGIRVQLEAVVVLEETTFRGRIRDVKTVERNILQGTVNMGLANPFTFSPVGTQVFGENFDDPNSGKTSFTLKEGMQTFSFAFQMTGDPLPVPFKKRETSLDFQVVAYIKDSIYFVKMGSVSVSFPGYRSLFRVPSIPRPLSQESMTEIKSTLFTTSTARLIMRTIESEFLPGEEITFQMSLLCRKPLTIEYVKVKLIRRTTYNISGLRRLGACCLDRTESNEMISDNGTLTYSGKLAIPRECIPSFKENDCYNVIHLIQYAVRVTEHPVEMKGKVEVIIGTTRDSPEVLQSREYTAFPRLTGENGEGCLRRSRSIESKLSDCSLLTLPPAYSQLSSRTVSLASFETLPPNYEDLENTFVVQE